MVAMAVPEFLANLIRKGLRWVNTRNGPTTLALPTSRGMQEAGATTEEAEATAVAVGIGGPRAPPPKAPQLGMPAAQHEVHNRASGDKSEETGQERAGEIDVHDLTVAQWSAPAGGAQGAMQAPIGPPNPHIPFWGT